MTDLKIIYTPEGGSRREWVIDMQNPVWDVHKYAPKAAGCRGWIPFTEALEGLDADAWQAIIWVLRKREERGLAFDSVNFPSGLMKEIDFAAQCPSCREWLTTEDGEGEHSCPAVTDEQEGEGGTGEV